MSELDLQETIQAALSEVAEPDEDNSATDLDAVAEVEFDGAEAEEVGDSAPVDEDELEDSESADEDDAEEPEDEFDDNPVLDEKFTVKVDGDEVEITVKEALEGYQRREDYTRKTQELAEARRAFESEIEEYAEVLDNVSAFEDAWETDPSGVLFRLTAGTEDPTVSLVNTMKMLAVAGNLDPRFMEAFGIDDEMVRAWSQETELHTLRAESKVNQRSRAEEEAEVLRERAVAQAIAEYESQIDEIIADEGLRLSGDSREEFKRGLARYAQENGLTNLKAARKAQLFDESKSKKQLAEKTVARAKQKKSATAVTRAGSPAGGSPVAGEQDLRSLIQSTMKELS